MSFWKGPFSKEMSTSLVTAASLASAHVHLVGWHLISLNGLKGLAASLPSAHVHFSSVVPEPPQSLKWEIGGVSRCVEWIISELSNNSQLLLFEYSK